MTHTTDAERAEFEAWARSRYPSIDLTRDGGDYSKALAKDYWSLWQAARRAPAAPVQLPEPVAEIINGKLLWFIPMPSYSVPLKYTKGRHELVDAEQVRQLLAAHGIKVI